MPLKKIGVEKGKKGIITSYTLSCSKVFNEALANAFSISEKSILNIAFQLISSENWMQKFDYGFVD